MTNYVQPTFTAVDFVVFGVLLTIPAVLGLYIAYQNRRNPSVKKYFFGDKKMHPVSIGISTAVTSISAITMIGYPAEVYLVGTVFLWSPVAAVTAGLITIIYYVPFYSRLQLDTIYGYLELRFNRTARRIISVMVPISEVFYMSVMIYLPSLALNAVARISINWSIILIGGICTFYTTLGGMKAVVWTDVVQSVFMLFGSGMLLMQGIIAVGGFGAMEAALSRGNRTTFMQFENFDISSRMHPVAVAVGDFFMFTRYLGFAQPIYQRILSCGSTRESQYSVVAYIIPAVIIITISVSNGLMMYAYFEGCDPVKSGLLKGLDQGAPYMALKEFSHLPGLAGMFVAAVFSGTLSTISSGLNAYSNVVVEDFAVTIFPKMSEKMRLLVGKISGAILGTIVVVFSYVISHLGDNTYKIIRSLAGAITGPVLGIYLLGIFIPWTNSLGAILGASISYFIMVWIFLGSIFLLDVSPRVQLPPRDIGQCPVDDVVWNQTTFSTMEMATVSTSQQVKYTFDQAIYSLNFHYYILFGGMMTVGVGLIVSFISGPNRPSEMDPKLFMPIFDNPKLPTKFVKFFRFGVPTEREFQATRKAARNFAADLQNDEENKCLNNHHDDEKGTELKELPDERELTEV